MSGHFQLGDIHPYKYFISVALVLGLLFATITPSETQPFWHLLIQWQVQAFTSVVLLIASHVFLSSFSGFNSLPVWLRILISGQLGCLLYTPVALAIDVYWVGDSLSDNIFMDLLDELGGVFVPVIVAWFLMNAPWLLGMRYQKVERGTSVKNIKEAPVSDSRLLNEAGLTFFAEITHMSAELHYLDVHSQADHKLILYSLKDAVKEIPAGLGMQIHRSHWVAYDSIEDIHKLGRQGEVELHNGSRLPISRANFSSVMDAHSKQA